MSEVAKHSPGPWRRDGRASDSMGSAVIRDAVGFEVANSRSWLVEAYEANANLITAAPEMYALLKDTLPWLEQHADHDTNELWARIAKVLRSVECSKGGA